MIPSFLFLSSISVTLTRNKAFLIIHHADNANDAGASVNLVAFFFSNLLLLSAVLLLVVLNLPKIDG